MAWRSRSMLANQKCDKWQGKPTLGRKSGCDVQQSLNNGLERCIKRVEHQPCLPNTNNMNEYSVKTA
jgi:hypothetical protein